MNSYFVQILMLALVTGPIVAKSDQVLETVVSNETKSYTGMDFTGSAMSPALPDDTDDNSTSRCDSSSRSPRCNVRDSDDSYVSILLLEKFLAEEKAKLLLIDQSGESETDAQRASDKSAAPSNGSLCLTHIDVVMKATRIRLQWALELLDASGKPGSGVLREGILPFLGDFDECMDLNTGQDFQGRYCTTNIRITEIQNVTFSKPALFFFGICLPSSCDTKEAGEIINTYLESHPNIVAAADRTVCQMKEIPWTLKAIAVICFCSLFATLLLVATVYDGVYKRWLKLGKTPELPIGQAIPMSESDKMFAANGSASKSDFAYPLKDEELMHGLETANAARERPSISEKLDQLLMTFSMYTNSIKLFTTDSQGSIDCIYGIRFISMLWIILFHIFCFGIPVLAGQKYYLEKAYRIWYFMVVPNGVIAVDSFFAISGLLMAYLVFKRLSKDTMTLRYFGHFYFHRIWRLTPTYALVMFTYLPLFKYVSNGPIWPPNGAEINECEDTWWTNLLYVNNFVKDRESDSTNPKLSRQSDHGMDTCMVWTWYLANDMQFFIISPVIILPIIKYKRRGLLVPLASLLGNAIVSGIVSQVNDLPGVQRLEQFGPNPDGNYIYVYYVKPYTRIGPYVVGILAGYFLHESKCKAKLSQNVVILGWAVATLLAVLVVYGPFETMAGNPWITEVHALYNALHRIAWAVCICWLIFACANGYGGCVNRFLSWKVFVPLSRLTYCAFLIHSVVLFMFLLSQRRLLSMTNNNMVLLYVTVVVLAYMVAYVLYIAYEAPILALEKFITGKRTNSRKGNKGR